MNRVTKLKLNTFTGLFFQLITIICGFILPPIILRTYGSAVNGLVNSITQFLGLIVLCELGVGAVVQSSLYKPLANNNINDISKIIVSSKRFFNIVAMILLGYVILLIIAFPLSVLDKFDFFYTAVLILAISISSFAQYFFGINNTLLLNADQKAYLPNIINSITLVFNTIICVFLINSGFSIQLVKLTTSLIYLLRPLVQYIYVKHKYQVNYSIKLDNEPIKQKWNGLAQHIAFVVLVNNSVIVLTLFSSLENVSVYSVYYLIVSGLQKIIISLLSGSQALIGNMLANNENSKLKDFFENFEWSIHTLVVFLFTMAGLLSVSFIKIYTKGINDVNYEAPVFSIIMTLAYAMYCIQRPYSVTILAAGHYKQTQSSSIIEAGLNVIISIILVFSFGIIGVAIGTLIAMTYRVIYFIYYLKKNILFRPYKRVIKQFLIDLISVILIILCTIWWISIRELTYKSWIYMALQATAICVPIILIINLIFYRSNIKYIMNKFFKKRKKESSLSVIELNSINSEESEFIKINENIESEENIDK